ncbi:MAG: hypothetical protein U0798_03125 [Gemmataceae bacterium]
MVRTLLGLMAAFTACLFVASASAEDKGKEVKLEGKIVCTKCKLKEADACGNALVVKDGEKTTTYYFDDKGEKEKYHVCSGEKAATVTAKCTVKDGKKVLSDAKVEVKK